MPFTPLTVRPAISAAIRPRVRLAALALAVSAVGAHAAELGEATVRSYIGQPLAAEIELTDLSTQDLADLQARLARPDVFQGAGVTMNPALASATIAVVKRDQRRVLRVTTNTPVQADMLHLFFQLSASGKERVRTVTLWLSPDPTPPAPVRMAAAPVPAVPAVPTPAAAPAERHDKPAQRRETGSQLIAQAAPGKDATRGERELMDAVERAFASRAPKEEASRKVSKPSLAAQTVREEALKYASGAEDFKRGAKSSKPPALEKPAAKVAAKASEAKPAEEELASHSPQPKPARMMLASKAELAEAARATKAAVEAGKGAPAKVAQAAQAVPAPVPALAPAPGKPADDPAMMKKLAELEGKLKALQAMVGEGKGAPGAGGHPPVAAKAGAPASGHAAPNAVAANAALAATAHAAPAAPAAQAKAAPAIAHAADAPQQKSAMPAAVAAAPAQPAAAPSQPAPAAQHAAAGKADEPESVDIAAAEGGKAADEPGEHVAASAEATSAAAVATVDEAKPKEAAPPPPPPEEKDVKISRPKLLTFLFAGSMVLLVIFGVIVHFIRKAKNKRSPIVRQSWSRLDDDEPRTEPTAGPAPVAAAAADSAPAKV